MGRGLVLVFDEVAVIGVFGLADGSVEADGLLADGHDAADVFE